MRFPELYPLEKAPVLPAIFQGKIAINSTCECTDHELKLLGAALNLVAQVAESDPPINTSKINVIFFDTESLEIRFDDTTSIGCYFGSIFYPIGLWRTAGYSDSTILFAMIEELCHALWLVNDGPEVQQKVETILRLANPHAKYSSFLAKAFMERLSWENKLKRTT